MQHLSKENIGLVGEYLVAAELCKRDIYAQLTLGNHKKTGWCFKKYAEIK